MRENHSAPEFSAARRFASKRRWLGLAVTVASVGVMFQLPSCTPFFSRQTLSSFDFCSVLNCEGSTFFDFCGDDPLLVDCPGFQPEDEDDG